MPETERRHPLAKCEDCTLNDSESAFVPTVSGSTTAIVGEAPGFKEGKSGIPFSGPSGKLLDAVLSNQSITRDGTTITNVVLCRPPDNRTPSKKEIECCSERLKADLAGHETIIALGNTAASAVLGRATKITKERVGPPKESPLYPGAKVIPTFHPAACLRSADNFPYLFNDIAKIHGHNTVGWHVPDYKVFTNPAEGKLALKELGRYNELVIDIETAFDKDADYEPSHLIDPLCIGVAYEPTKVVIFDRSCVVDEGWRRLFGDLLQRARLVCHNGKYDLAWMQDISPNCKLYFDTMLASYCLDERRGVHSLGYMGVEVLGTPDWKAEAKKFKNHLEMYEKDRAAFFQYNAYDCATTFQLKEWAEKELANKDLRRLHDFLVAASNELMHVERQGVFVDQTFLAELEERFHRELLEAERQLSRWVANPRSPKQVKEALEAMAIVEESTAKDVLVKIICEELKLPLTFQNDIPALLEFLPDLSHTERSEFIWRMLDYRKEQKLYGCVDEDTEILTDRGWLKYNEVREGDSTLSINPKTGLSEWDIIDGIHLYPGEHELISMQGRDFSALTTHDHRWLSYHSASGKWRWQTTDTLNTADRIPKAALCSSLPAEPKYTDEFVELVAWLWTEGSVDGKGFNIIQSHEVNYPNVERIRSALLKLCPKPVFNKNHHTSYEYWSERIAAHGCTEFYIGKTLAEQFKSVLVRHKLVSIEFIRSLTKAQLQLFVDVSMLADGKLKTKYEGNARISQSNLEQLFPFQLACCLLGIPISTKSEYGIHFTWLHIEKFFTTIQRPRGFTVSNQHYSGTVWCVSTRNANWLARRQGKVYYTGNTYVKGTRKRLYDGRLYPTFLLHGTTTGRLSCRNPNVQNIPRGSSIRNLFIPAEGNVFVQGDYSQAELRTIATLAEEPYLRSVFAEGRDIHGEVASAFYGPNFTKEQRVKAKMVVFGLSYDMSAHGLAIRMGIPKSEANKFLKTFFSVIPNVDRWRKELERKIMTEQDDLVTPFGRHRRLWLITKENADDVRRESLAFLPQSIASDICLSALIRLRPMLSGTANIRITVHDSILAECNDSDKDEVAATMKQVMEEAALEFTDYVPFKADIGIGTKWGELS